MHNMLWSFELNEESETQQTPHKKVVFHIDKLKDKTHSLNRLLHSSWSLSCLETFGMCL